MATPRRRPPDRERPLVLHLVLHVDPEQFTIITRIGDKIMAQIDDVKASLQASNDKLAEVATKVDAVQAEVQVLIDKINTIPPTPDLTEVLAMAQAVQDKVGAVSADLDTTPQPPPAEGSRRRG